MDNNTVLVGEKKCATCEYWRGSRKIQFIDDKPNCIDIQSGNFTCIAQGNKSTQGIGRCSKWKNWLQSDFLNI